MSRLKGLCTTWSDRGPQSSTTADVRTVLPNEISLKIILIKGHQLTCDAFSACAQFCGQVFGSLFAPLAFLLISLGRLPYTSPESCRLASSYRF